MNEPVFVFGSNLAGVHGAGAARFALMHHGAVWGAGIGMFGNSYAIPTKDENINTLPLGIIQAFVDQFKAFAAEHPELTFQVTPIGCGLAGYKPEQIKPMFDGATPNCIMPAEFGGDAPRWKG